MHRGILSSLAGDQIRLASSTESDFRRSSARSSPSTDTASAAPCPLFAAGAYPARVYCAAAVSAAASVRSVMAQHHRWMGRGVQGPRFCYRASMEPPPSADPTIRANCASRGTGANSWGAGEPGSRGVVRGPGRLALARLTLEDAQTRDTHDAPQGETADWQRPLASRPKTSRSGRRAWLSRRSRGCVP